MMQQYNINNTKNPHRKCSNFHLTYMGHYQIHIPMPVLHLAYCHEGPETDDVAQDHTHAVLVTARPVSKTDMLQLMQAQIHPDYPCNIRIDVHSQWQTMFHYHIGLGKRKGACQPGLIWISDPPYLNVEDYIIKVKAHQPTLVKSQLVLNLGIAKCIDEGIIPLIQGSLYSKSITTYFDDKKASIKKKLDNSLLLASGGAGAATLLPPAKKRHYWVYGESNTGKTTWCEQQTRQASRIFDNDELAFYNVPRNNDWKDYQGQKYIIINEYIPSLIDISTLQDMVDAKNYKVNYKGGSHILTAGAIFYITTRNSPKETFNTSFGNNSEDVEGILNRFHVQQMKLKFNSTSSLTPTTTTLPYKKIKPNPTPTPNMIEIGTNKRQIMQSSAEENDILVPDLNYEQKHKKKKKNNNMPIHIQKERRYVDDDDEIEPYDADIINPNEPNSVEENQDESFDQSFIDDSEVIIKGDKIANHENYMASLLDYLDKEEPFKPGYQFVFKKEKNRKRKFPDEVVDNADDHNRRMGSNPTTTNIEIATNNNKTRQIIQASSEDAHIDDIDDIEPQNADMIHPNEPNSAEENQDESFDHSFIDDSKDIQATAHYLTVEDIQAIEQREREHK